jgi:hypothetical protein
MLYIRPETSDPALTRSCLRSVPYSYVLRPTLLPTDYGLVPIPLPWDLLPLAVLSLRLDLELL